MQCHDRLDVVQMLERSPDKEGIETFSHLCTSSSTAVRTEP